MQMCMRIVVLAAAVVLAPSALMAQTDPNANNPPPPGGGQGAAPPPGGAVPSAELDAGHAGAPGQTGQEMVDKQFIRTAAEGGMAEVKLGMLATQKGGPEVKDLGQKMVDDHTAINKDMAAVADTLGVMLPKKMNKDGQAGVRQAERPLRRRLRQGIHPLHGEGPLGRPARLPHRGLSGRRSHPADRSRQGRNGDPAARNDD